MVSSAAAHHQITIPLIPSTRDAAEMFPFILRLTGSGAAGVMDPDSAGTRRKRVTTEYTGIWEMGKKDLSGRTT